MAVLTHTLVFLTGITLAVFALRALFIRLFNATGFTGGVAFFGGNA